MAKRKITTVHKVDSVDLPEEKTDKKVILTSASQLVETFKRTVDELQRPKPEFYREPQFVAKANVLDEIHLLGTGATFGTDTAPGTVELSGPAGEVTIKFY